MRYLKRAHKPTFMDMETGPQGPGEGVTCVSRSPLTPGGVTVHSVGRD